MVTDAREQFRAAIAASGLTPPDTIMADGELHRFASDGTRGDDAGWYVYHGNGVPAGGFGCWRTGLSESWRANIDRKLTAAEREAQARRIEDARRKREADEARRHAEAGALAVERWRTAKPADPAHPYLAAKGVRPHGVRQEGELLLIPMRADGELHSLQTIAPDGDKRFLPGGRVAGCYHSIGKPDGVICIAEGYATGATIHEATGHAVAVAFNAGNLAAVAAALRAKVPDARIILCADDDYRTAGNPGMTKATEAARAVGGLVAVPDFGADRPEGATDFNDLDRHGGAAAVRQAVERASAPQAPNDQPHAGNAAAGDSGPCVELLCAADVTPEAVRWHWPGWLAAGKLHILAGPPGTGKTTLALALAATITTGGRWPDGARATVGNVAIWSGEDGIADTIVPRLIAHGADVSRVHIVRGITDEGGKRLFDPATDTPALMLELARMPESPALLIVDPIVSAVAGDSHKNAETRRALQPLVEVGERIGCAIIGISHFAKGTANRDPVERVTGSIAFGALARLVLAAAETKTAEGDAGPRLFVRAKSNLGPSGGGFHYEIEQAPLPARPDLLASCVCWGDPVEGRARELLAVAEMEPDADARSMTDEAEDWLREFLACGAMPAADAVRESRKLGLSDKAIRKARERLGVKSHKAGMQDGWEWVLPRHTKAPTSPEGVEDAQPLKRGALGAFGNAGAPSGPSTADGEVF